MAITTGSKIAVSLSMRSNNQTMMNVWTYGVLELVGIPNAAQYAEAWWNHVKANYRAIAPAGWPDAFRSVRVVELGDPAGEYGEYGIPAGEQSGTRSNPTDSDAQPTFLAAGVRLSVATRATRPGQKRFPFLLQQDNVSDTLGSAYRGLLVTLMDQMASNLTLGAPAAGVVLVPLVVSLSETGTINASQGVSGYVINTLVTSQNSRKVGRGV